MTKRKAKRLSILKWKYIVNNDGSDEGLVDAVPELAGLEAECGYCEKYCSVSNGCSECPLKTEELRHCLSYGHPYDIWARNKTVKHAQAMLDLIRKT